MKNKLSKSKLLILQSGTSLVAVFAMLVISVAAAISLSFGWFAKNNQVTANGMHVQAYRAQFSATYKVKGEDKERDVSNLFNGLAAPGDTVDILVTIKNTGRYDVSLTQFGFEAPTSREDVPKTDESGNLRYLSTELYAQLLSVSGTDYSKDPYEILYPLDPDKPTPEHVHFLREGDTFSPGTANRIDFISDMGEGVVIPLAAGETVTFKIRVTFAKTEHDQNIYKGFADGEGKGACTRRFFLTYDN